MKNEKINNIEYDFVVIGAGNAGLIAATTLANKGYKTLIVEQHNLPGGFASSFVRGRFEFEIALHELGNLGNEQNQGDVYKIFKELGIKIDWCEIHDAFRLIVKNSGLDFDCTMPFGRQAFIDACEKLEPGSKKSVTNFMDVCQNLFEAVRYIKSTRGNPDPKVMKKLYPNYLTCSVYTLEEGLNKLKIPKIIKFIIESYWLYLGIKPSDMNFSLFGIMFYEYINFSAYIPKNRSHEISQKIIDRFQALGGTIWYNTKAEKIDIKNNQVVGLKTSNGYIKTRHIISNASPHITYGTLIDNKNIPEIDKKITSYREPGSQGFVIYLGLNKSLEELGIKDYSYFILDELDHNKIFDKAKDITKNNNYIVVALNIANPDCSEKGTSILTFTALYEDAWNNVDKKDYFKTKNELAKKFITDFEKKLNIEIIKHIEEIEVATPVTFARYTGTMNGAIYGYKSTLKDSTYVRARKMDEYYTINGLRFCGGNGITAHGYSITYVSGDIVANKSIVDYKNDNEVNNG